MKNEDQNVEYKRSWQDEHLKWICGFANADGGRMFIGVLDDKLGNKVVGVENWKKLLEEIPKQMRDTMGMIAEVEGPVAKAIVRCLVSKELRASEIAKCIGQNSRTGHFKRCMKDLIQRRIIESIGSKGKTDPMRKYRLSAAYCGR